VRVGLNPQALFNQGVSLDAVRTAISQANVRRPQGAIEDATHRWQVQTNDALKTAAEYQPLIIHYNNGAAVRLSDVASVTDSVQDMRNAGMTNAKPAILLMIRNCRKPTSFRRWTASALACRIAKDHSGGD
jgi:multidrug efflux pump